MFIDIHSHCRRRPIFPRDGRPTFLCPEQLLQKEAELGIERGVISSDVHPECTFGVQSVEDVLEICEKYPSFIPFCNVDPRAMSNSSSAPLDDMLKYYRDRGCRGVGEVAANLPIADPRVQNLFRCCEIAGLPLTFHLAPQEGGCYGLVEAPGLPQLEQALQQYPKLIFLGHSQLFWAEIGTLRQEEDRLGYPNYGIDAPGRVVELMRRYPNLYGDLSAGSGCNALKRDRQFGVAFLQEFQDRLLFGTDICTVDTPTPLAGYLQELLKNGEISDLVFQKIAKRNALKILKLD